MSHLRSKLVVRIPRSSLPQNLPRELQDSALFMKGSHVFEDGSRGSFHVQITSAGLAAQGGSEQLDDQPVVITLSGIGETHPDPGQRTSAPVLRTRCYRTHGVPTVLPSPRDSSLWNAMDDTCNALVEILAGGQRFEVHAPGRGWVEVAPGVDLRNVVPYSYRDALTPGRRDRLRAGRDEVAQEPEWPASSRIEENSRIEEGSAK
jgi:hypothetical protein